MPAVLFFLTLLGALCSHGQAMTREEKQRLRWDEKTVQLEKHFLPRKDVTHVYLCLCFLFTKGTKWLRCLTMHIRIIW